MATIKSYSDIEQSNKLLELGLNPKSADLEYKCVGFTMHANRPTDNFKYKVMLKEQSIPHGQEYNIPCWSLAALLEILDYPQLSKDKLGSGKVGWMVSVYPNDCRYDSCWHDNPVDACYEIILKLNM